MAWLLASRFWHCSLQYVAALQVGHWKLFSGSSKASGLRQVPEIDLSSNTAAEFVVGRKSIPVHGCQAASGLNAISRSSLK